MSSYYPYSSRPSNPNRVLLWPLLILLVLVGVLVWRFWPRRSADLSPDAVPRAVSVREQPFLSDEKTNIHIYETVVPSVVHITNLAERQRGLSLDPEQIPRGTGSGFVWSENGIIVTNAHVVDGADAMEVILPDKERSTYEAKSWVSYKDKDLAVLYIDAPKKKLKPIRIGSSEQLKVGQNAYAIGNPFGLDQSFTTGVISALDRVIRSDTGRPIHGVIQTSAAINPGNSGGPLLDSDGALIGVNTAIISPNGTFAGIGFAIPIDEVNQIVPRLVQELDKSIKQNKGPQTVETPFMGVEPARDQLARELGVTDGVLIVRVSPRTPAARAGLRGTTLEGRSGQRLGDVIVAIAGDEVHTTKDLFTVLEHHQPGETVTVTVLRDGKRQDVPLTLGVRR